MREVSTVNNKIHFCPKAFFIWCGLPILLIDPETRKAILSAIPSISSKRCVH